MKILIYSHILPFVKDNKVYQLENIINHLSETYEIFLLLPFSETDEIIYLDYEYLSKKNIILPSYYKNCKFISYKTLNIHLINSIIIDKEINLFMNLFSLFNLNTGESNNYIKCRSLFWCFDEFNHFNKDYLKYLEFFDQIICHSPNVYSILKKMFHNKIFYSDPMLRKEINIDKENVSNKLNINSKSNLITVKIDSNNTFSIDLLLKLWYTNTSINEKNDNYLFIYSDNNIVENNISFKLPKDFNLGDDFKIDNKYIIKTNKDLYQLDKLYTTTIKVDKLLEFTNKFNYKNIILNNNQIDINSVLKYSSHFIDLSLGKNGYMDIIYAQNNNIPTLTFNLNNQHRLIKYGNLIEVKTYKMNGEDFIIFERDELENFIYKQNFKTFDDNLEKNHFNDIINNSLYNTYLNKKGNIIETNCSDNKDMEKTIFFLNKYNINCLYLIGTINPSFILYILTEFKYLTHLYIIYSKEFTPNEKSFINQIKMDFTSVSINLNYIEDIKNDSIINSINVFNKPNHLILVKKLDNIFNDSITSLLNKSILQSWYIDNKEFSFYKIIRQDEKDISNYKLEKLNKRYLVSENDNHFYLKLSNKEKCSYENIIFSGVNAQELLMDNNWYQNMIVNKYLHYKNNLSDPKAFIRFFRHRILWEELYEKKIYNVIIQEIGKESSKVLINSNPAYFPNVDIIFFKKYFNMDKYFVTKSGLEKLIQYTKPMIFPLEIQIQNIILTQKIYIHCIGLELNSDHNLLIEKVEKNKNIKKTIPQNKTIDYFNYIPFYHYLPDFYNYFKYNVSNSYTYIKKKCQTLLLKTLLWFLQ